MHIKWVADTKFDILEHAWGTESVIYHSGSGDTQLVDDIGLAIINYLKDKPADLDEILGFTNRTLNLNIDERSMASLLDGLSRSGMITHFQM